MTIRKMEEMTWKEFEQLDKKETVIMLALSPIEEHGPHLPLGTDFIAAKDCLWNVVNYLEKMDTKYNYIIHPPFPFGYNEAIMDFPGTMFYKAKTIENVLIDFGEAIARNGLDKIVIINHHLDLGHVKAINNVKEYLSDKYNIKLLEVASSIIYSEENHREGSPKQDDDPREIHADIRETSFMLYKHPQLVKDCYKTLEPAYLDMKKFIMTGGKYFRDNGIKEGYIGSPAKATFEYGRKQFQAMVIQTATLILRFIEDGYIPEIASSIKSAMKRI